MSTPLKIDFDITGETTSITTLIAENTLWMRSQGAASAIDLQSNGVINLTTVDTLRLQVDTAKISAFLPVKLPSYTVATLPSVVNAGAVIYVSDADGSSETGSLCFSNGTNWIDVTTGNPVTD